MIFQKLQQIRFIAGCTFCQVTVDKWDVLPCMSGKDTTNLDRTSWYDVSNPTSCILMHFEWFEMKRTSILLLVLATLSVIAGYLLSKASLVGRMGISLFYKQYAFLKVWWQTALLFFFVWVLLFVLQGWAQRKLSPNASRLLHIGTLLAALTGIFFTYQDFRHTLSHRWLGERFHLGGYLFWVGWILISLFYITDQKKTISPDTLLAGKDAITSDNEHR